MQSHAYDTLATPAERHSRAVRQVVWQAPEKGGGITPIARAAALVRLAPWIFMLVRIAPFREIQGRCVLLEGLIETLKAADDGA